MERIIEIAVRGLNAVQTNDMEYVCDNTEYIAVFDFDAEWDGVDPKTARFVYGGTHQDVVFTGNRCEIPRISDVDSMRVGAFAGNLVTTTPAQVICRRSILGKGGLPADPSPDVYAQIMEVAFPAAVAAAEESATQAAESEQNAKVSETNAEQSAKNAAESAKNLNTAEKNAKESAEQAKNSETNAKASEGNAKTSENNAKASETAASGSASSATLAKENAEKAKTAAETAANRAETARQGIEQFVSGAEKSATDAKEAAQKAEQHETNAKTAEQNVMSYESQFAAYAQEAKTAAETAKKSASDADTDAKTASQKASDAKTYANNANTAANNAKTSETNAAVSAVNAEKARQGIEQLVSNAEQSATAAAGSAAAAEQAKNDAEKYRDNTQKMAVKVYEEYTAVGGYTVRVQDMTNTTRENTKKAEAAANRAEAAANSVDLPKPTADNAGKAVVVNAAGDGFTFGEAAGGGSGGGAQADWNAAEGEPGHILNKPFGTEEWSGEIIPECNPIDNDGMFMLLDAVDIAAGYECVVLWNGTEYQCTAENTIVEGMPLVAFGNMVAVGGVNTGEPFFIGCLSPEMAAQMGAGCLIIPLDGSEELTLKVTAKVTDVKKLDNEYLDLEWLPTTLPGKTLIPGASVTGDLTIHPLNIGPVTEYSKISVLCDGTWYQCNVIAQGADGGFVGNMATMGGPDTGEPFGIVLGQDNAMVHFMDENRHFISAFDFTTTDETCRVPLPLEYLPNVVARTYNVPEWFKLDTNTRLYKLEFNDKGELTMNDAFWNQMNKVDRIPIERCTESYTYGVTEYKPAYSAVRLKNDNASNHPIATGAYAFAEGHLTLALGRCQHAEGEMNVADTEDKFLHIVGNGSSSTGKRSNAYTLDWDGNGWFAGSVEATHIILKSSTEGSTKRFKITVDDSGTLSATAI